MARCLNCLLNRTKSRVAKVRASGRRRTVPLKPKAGLNGPPVQSPSAIRTSVACISLPSVAISAGSCLIPWRRGKCSSANSSECVSGRDLSQGRPHPRANDAGRVGQPDKGFFAEQNGPAPVMLPRLSGLPVRIDVPGRARVSSNRELGWPEMP